MKLGQHFYTSGKPEFMTVAMTDGITRDDRIYLESHSIYFLPISLHYQDNVTAPVKYVWYPLGEHAFVVGRAIYVGKDSLGRTGNYLFHNLIISRDELLTQCQGNPASLIKCLRQRQIFQDTPPAGGIQPISLPDDACAVPATAPRQLARDLLQRILHACLAYGSLSQPVLLLGTDGECLDFLELLYTVLPYEIRLGLRVDTYAYGISLGFPMIGSVDEDVFRQGLTASFTLRLSNLETTVYEEFPAPSPYLTMLLDMITAGNMRALHEVFSLEYLLAEQRFADFKQEFQQASLDIRRILWDFHGSQMLNHIAAEQDIALLHMIRPLLKVEHLDTLYLAPELIDHLIADNDPSALALVAEWLCVPGSKEFFYPTLFASETLWTVWLDTVQARPDTAPALLNPLKAFQQHYAVAPERTLLEHLLLLLPALRENRKLARDVAELLTGFPPTGSPAQSADMTDTELIYLDVLRTFIRYEIGNDAELLDKLLVSDLTTLSTAQRTIVLERLLETIVVVRSLKIWNPEKTAQQIHTLLTKASQDATFAIDVLTALTKLKLSKDAHKVVEQVFVDLQSALIQGENGAHIQHLIHRVLESPPSMFSKLTQRLFGLKAPI